MEQNLLDLAVKISDFAENKGVTFLISTGTGFSKIFETAESLEILEDLPSVKESLGTHAYLGASLKLVKISGKFGLILFGKPFTYQGLTAAQCAKPFNAIYERFPQIKHVLSLS